MFKIRFAIKNLAYELNDVDLPYFYYRYENKDKNSFDAYILEHFGDNSNEITLNGGYNLLTWNSGYINIPIDKISGGIDKVQRVNCIEITDDRFSFPVYYRTSNPVLKNNNTIQIQIKRDIWLTDFSKIKYGVNNVNTSPYVKRTHVDRFYEQTKTIKSSNLFDIKFFDTYTIMFNLSANTAKGVDVNASLLNFTLYDVNKNPINLPKEFEKAYDPQTDTYYGLYYFKVLKGDYKAASYELDLNLGSYGNFPANSVFLSGSVLEDDAKITFSNLKIDTLPTNNGDFTYRTGTSASPITTTDKFLANLTGTSDGKTPVLSTEVNIETTSGDVGDSVKIVGVGLTQPSKDIETLHFDYTPNSKLFNNDPQLENFKPTKSFINRAIIQRTYEQSLFTKDVGDSTKRWMYAIITQNVVFFDKTNPQNKGLVYTDSNTIIKNPVLIAPLSPNNGLASNTYANIIKAGNEAVLKIFYSDVPLINDSVWNNPITLSNDEYQGLGDVVVFRLEDLYKNWFTINGSSYNIDQYYAESITDDLIGYPLYFEKDKLHIDEPYNYMYEPKLYMDPHFKISLQYAKSTREIRNEYLWANKEESLDIRLRWIVDITLFTKIGFINNGLYSLSNNIEDCAYMYSGSFDFPNTSNSETNYFQNHKNAYNTAKWSYQYQGDYGIIKGALGAVGGAGMAAMGVATGNPFAVAGGASAAVGGIFNAGQAKITQDIQEKTLQAKVADFERVPFQLSGAGNDDALSLLMIQKDLIIDNEVSATPLTYLNYKTLSPLQQQVIANKYNKFGYIIDNTQRIDFYELSSNRYKFNYWEIDDFSSAVDKDSIIPDALSDVERLFKRGVRLWTYYGENEYPNEFKNYDKENWENTAIGVINSIPWDDLGPSVKWEFNNNEQLTFKTNSTTAVLEFNIEYTDGTKDQVSLNPNDTKAIPQSTKDIDYVVFIFNPMDQSNSAQIEFTNITPNNASFWEGWNFPANADYVNQLRKNGSFIMPSITNTPFQALYSPNVVSIPLTPPIIPKIFNNNEAATSGWDAGGNVGQSLFQITYTDGTRSSYFNLNIPTQSPTTLPQSPKEIRSFILASVSRVAAKTNWNFELNFKNIDNPNSFWDNWTIQYIDQGELTFDITDKVLPQLQNNNSCLVSLLSDDGSVIDNAEIMFTNKGV